MRAHLDTNVILRYLTGAPPEPAARARELFSAAEQGRLTLFVPDVILLETGFVLLRILRLEAPKVSALLGSLVEAPGLEIERRETVRLTLELFQQGQLGLVDAYLAAHALSQEEAGRPAVVASFDRDLSRVPGIQRISGVEELA